MLRHADLELNLWALEAGSYRLEIRYSNPRESDADASEETAVRLDLDALHTLLLTQKYKEYGAALFTSVLGSPAVRGVLQKAWEFSQRHEEEVALHLRLRCAENAANLHALWWELLRYDEKGPSLVTNENILFSRYLAGTHMATPRLRSVRGARALGVLANPSDVEAQGFAPIKPELELSRLKAALGDKGWDMLGDGEPVTLERLVAKLRDGDGYDILYLVAHGRLGEHGAEILLQKDDGLGEFVAGDELGRRIQELRRRPNLVVLASCESAGDGAHNLDDPSALLSLGPLLVRHGGVPAVVAMHGQVSMKTVAAFMPKFFQELAHDGQPDSAMAVARRAVRDQDDSWMPVLYTRLRSTAIWYNAELSPRKEGEDPDTRWKGLIANLRDRQCVPILGPDLGEPLTSLRRSLAATLAAAESFPLAPPSQADLPRVAQHLALSQDHNYPRARIVDELISALRRDLKKPAAADMGWEAPEPLAELDALLGERWERDLLATALDPYATLAKMGVKIFVTADQSSLFLNALAKAGRAPLVALWPWNGEIIEAQRHLPCRKTDKGYQPDAAYVPSLQEPLVFYAFGHLDLPASLVLAEDEFFQYLIGVTEHLQVLNSEVKKVLARSSHIYLGFRPDDWYFRTLFRVVRSLPGSDAKKTLTRVAAQIPPDVEEVYDYRGARTYLKKFFGAGAVDLYWGSVEDFLRDLQEKMARPGQ